MLEFEELLIAVAPLVAGLLGWLAYHFVARSECVVGPPTDEESVNL